MSSLVLQLRGEMQFNLALEHYPLNIDPASYLASCTKARLLVSGSFARHQAESFTARAVLQSNQLAVRSYVVS